MLIIGIFMLNALQQCDVILTYCTLWTLSSPHKPTQPQAMFYFHHRRPGLLLP